MRVVLDLKAEVKPQVFTLKPIGDYGHRLVLDLYPVVPPDPLAALIELDGKIAGSAGAARRGPGETSPRWRGLPPSSSTPGTAARTRARAAAAARAKRTSR